METLKIKQSNKLEVGMILYSSWGWEQTNVSWYKVVKRTEKRVVLQRLKEIREYTGDMCGVSLPSEELYSEQTITAVANSVETKICNGGYAEYLNVWDGRGKRFSSYA